MFRALRANGGRVPTRAALRVVLPTADGRTNAITKAIGKGKTAVWRWQERLMHEEILGLTRDETRPSRVRPLPRSLCGRTARRRNSGAPRATNFSQSHPNHSARFRERDSRLTETKIPI